MLLAKPFGNWLTAWLAFLAGFEELAGIGGIIHGGGLSFS